MGTRHSVPTVADSKVIRDNPLRLRRRLLCSGAGSNHRRGLLYRTGVIRSVWTNPRGTEGKTPVDGNRSSRRKSSFFTRMHQRLLTGKEGFQLHVWAQGNPHFEYTSPERSSQNSREARLRPNPNVWKNRESTAPTLLCPAIRKIPRCRCAFS